MFTPQERYGIVASQSRGAQRCLPRQGRRLTNDEMVRSTSNVAMCGDDDVARNGGERGLRSVGNLEQTAQRGVV